MKKFDHIDEMGKINLIDITGKPERVMEADASGFIQLKPETIKMIKENEQEKGEVITVAELAGMQAAKSASQLIPLLHQTLLTRVDVKAYVYPNGIEVKSTLRAMGQAGLETEALTAVSVALLTLFEICKNLDSAALISDIKLTRKMLEAG